MPILAPVFRTRTAKAVHYEPCPRGPIDACDVAEDLVRAGITRDFFLYEKQGETRIGCDCLAKVSVTADQVLLEVDGDTVRSEPARDPFKQVESFLGSLPFSNWTAFGYAAFDLARFYHPYDQAIDRPLLQFVVPRFEVRVDSGSVGLHSFDDSCSDNLMKIVLERIANPSHRKSPKPTPPVLAFEDRKDYCDKVQALTSAIRGGVLQKAILSRRARIQGLMDYFGTYKSARVNHASRSYCFRIDDMGAVGYSPEILIEANGRGLVTTNPLAGTRPRGTDAGDDDRMWGELFTDAKEVKEHALSVLLVQEEMGSVCTKSSVRVFDFMEVKKFRCVQHLSSRVSGQLEGGRSFWDAFRVLFPGVTVSGISKSEALRWISDVEGEPRGIYGGGVGWVDSQGRADIAIAIRSAFQYGQSVHLNAGAGIVAESVPDREYTESVNKMNTMLSQIVMSNDRVA